MARFNVHRFGELPSAVSGHRVVVPASWRSPRHSPRPCTLTRVMNQLSSSFWLRHPMRQGSARPFGQTMTLLLDGCNNVRRSGDPQHIGVIEWQIVQAYMTGELLQSEHAAIIAMVPRTIPSRWPRARSADTSSTCTLAAVNR